MEDVIPVILDGWHEYKSPHVNAEKVKDVKRVQDQLVGIKMREQRREAARPAKIPAGTSQVSSIDDIPPEDRFWEGLPECPKCKAAVQPDWDACPFCGHKINKLRSPSMDK